MIWYTCGYEREQRPVKEYICSCGRERVVLSRRFDQDVHLTLRDTWTTWKSLVVRCAIAPPASHLPATIIAKRPYALLNDPFAHQVSFINEWAALVFLEQIATDLPLAPRCYGGDSTTSVLVLEDLGNDDQTTAQVLVFGTDPRRAEAALLEHVALIGYLHATTIGKYRAYAAIRAALNPPAQPWVQMLIQALQTALADRHVLELACGTGHWTSYAAAVARSVTATDIAPAMLACARDKLHMHRNVTVVATDAYRLDEVVGDFTAGLAMQWFSHIPKAHVPGFLSHWHTRLGPGAVVFLGDNQWRADDSDPLIIIRDDPNPYEIRTLPDGHQYTIIKNYYSADELRTMLAPAAEDLRITIGQRWWWLSYTIAERDHDIQLT